MMQRPSDEVLVAYLDGEVDETTAVEVESWLERDPELRNRLRALTESATQIRDAFEEILREPVPERLMAAAHGRTSTSADEPAKSATILSFGAKLASATARKGLANRRWGLGLVAAASLSFLVIGAGGGYLAGTGDVSIDGVQTTSTTNSWLDNIAGYHNLLISSANGAESTVFDVPAGTDKGLPTDIRIPDLKPWSLAFQGARKLVVEGKPAFQFFYTTDNKSLGPITITVTNTTRGDMSPTFAKRAGVNLLYWRHQGHGYALVGSADKGWMWGIANDIEFQLKAI